MKFTSLLQAALVAVFLCLGGCQAITTLGDYVSENPLVAQIATRQAVAQYISAGETIEEEIERAEQVKKRITKVLLFVDENAEATVPDLMAVIDDSIEWEQLTIQDRLLVQDIVALVEAELQKATEPIIPESTRIVLVTLFRTALSAAEIYVAG